MKQARQFCLSLLMIASAGASVAQPVSVLDLFNQARAYGVSAAHRACADSSLEPRVRDLQRRFAIALDRLTTVYGEERLRSIAIPIMVPDYPCTDPDAARRAVDGFAAAVSDLEAALRQNGAGERG